MFPFIVELQIHIR